MAIIFTKDRAERLASYMERNGYEVRRRYEVVPTTTRFVGGLTITGTVYATVWRDRHLVMVINHERIAERSPLL